ncbi:MAG: type II toxin-antitoxin system Phd/YefM family antitoxin [Gammaproteobacteria bacterium]
MYTTIGAFDAKAKLSELLREVKHGQHYTITLRGQPIADLIPSESATQRNAHAAVEMMHDIHKVVGVSEQTISEWIKEGRK